MCKTSYNDFIIWYQDNVLCGADQKQSYKDD
jgi:hypothetical protein